MWWIYALSVVFGLVGSVFVGKATMRPSIRILAGGVSGTGMAALLENGAAYSFLASAYYGGMGNTGYLLIGSLAILILTLVANMVMTKGRTGVL